jgi:hypothetical protein
VHRALLILSLGCAVAFASCGGDDSSNNEDARQNTTPGVLQADPRTKEKVREVSEQERYQITEQICRYKKLRGIRIEYGIKSTDPAKVARAFAQKAPEEFRDLVTRACLSGFQKSAAD